MQPVKTDFFHTFHKACHMRLITEQLDKKNMADID